MRLSTSIGAVLCGALILASVAGAQPPARRAPGTSPENQVGVTVALQAGADSYRSNAQGTCTHAPAASIYDVAAQQWRVEQRDGTRSLGLTFWKPASGGQDMFTLHLSGAGRSHTVSTTKGKAGGTVQGSGTVTFAPAGKGGAFTVNATTAAGTKISGTITCAAFTPAIAEGGH